MAPRSSKQPVRQVPKEPPQLEDDFESISDALEQGDYKKSLKMADTGVHFARLNVIHTYSCTCHVLISLSIYLFHSFTCVPPVCRSQPFKLAGVAYPEVPHWSCTNTSGTWNKRRSICEFYALDWERWRHPRQE